MSERSPQRYDETLDRIRDAASTHRLWNDEAEVSLPVPAALSRVRGRGRLAAFLYHTLPDGDRENPWIFSPYARVELRQDQPADIVEPLPSELVPPTLRPHRYTGLAAQMTPDERRSFTLTYFELLASPQGPLHLPWESIAPGLRGDLRTLFVALAERAFLPVYGHVAPSFYHALTQTQQPR